MKKKSCHFVCKNKIFNSNFLLKKYQYGEKALYFLKNCVYCYNIVFIIDNDFTVCFKYNNQL